MGRVLTLCLVLATVSYSSSTNLAKLSSTIHKISDVLQKLKNEPTTPKNDPVLKKPVGAATLDHTTEGSGNSPGNLSKEERNDNNSIKTDRLSGNKKLQSRHKKDRGIPQAMKPLQVVATSAVIRNRLNKRPRVSPKPVKAIHVWGPTPFNTVINNIMRMNNKMKEEEQQNVLPFQDNHLQGFNPVQSPEIKTPQLEVPSFPLPIKEQPIQRPQIIQINEHDGEPKNFESIVDEAANSRAVLQRPVFFDDQMNQDAPPEIAPPNEPQEDFYKHYLQYKEEQEQAQAQAQEQAQAQTQEQEQAQAQAQAQAQEQAQEQMQEQPEQEPLRNHYHRHHFHHHSTGM